MIHVVLETIKKGQRLPVGAPERRVNSITYVIELDYKNLFNMYRSSFY